MEETRGIQATTIIKQLYHPLFSNFLARCGEFDMIKIFQRWDRVKEVFISRRLKRWGRRFGFVRFFDVENVGRLETEHNQIHIGNMDLYVNILRYRRVDSEQKVGWPREARKQQYEHGDEPLKNNSKVVRKQHEYGYESRKNRSKEVWREKKGNEVWRANKGKKAQVGNSPMQT